MSVENISVNVVDPDGKWLYRVGGISALVIGIAYLSIFPLFALVGNPPQSGGELWLKYLEGKTTVWWAILGLNVFTDFLYVPVALSLYVALKRVNKNVMLIATAFVALFVVLDLAVTWTNYASLLTLSGLYSAAPNDAQRAGYIAAANYASAVLASHTEVFYSIVDLSLAILLTGFVMLKGKGIFNKTTAYLAVAAGIFGIAAITGLFVIIIINALLVTAWVFFAGYRLFRLAQN
ncbi:MAG TPA: hypothetical protein VN982_07580 [Candidatus Dormibacteraeota bacterium]|nr:hypothetical protein [Candidatus Dormibacteraeota bacterium]